MAIDFALWNDEGLAPRLARAEPLAGLPKYPLDPLRSFKFKLSLDPLK